MEENEYFTQLFHLVCVLPTVQTCFGIEFRQVLEQVRPDRKGHIHYSNPSNLRLNIQIFTQEQLWQDCHGAQHKFTCLPFHTAVRPTSLSTYYPLIHNQDL